MTVRPRSTKQYKALLAVGVSDAKALEIVTGQPAVDPRLTTLLEAGFDQATAEGILGAQFATPTAVAQVVAQVPVQAPAKPVTAKEVGEALVAQAGLAFTKGRVYVNGTVAEAIVRVLKGGGPEIAQTSGVGRSKAVLVFREESGDVAVQNLTTPVG